MSIERKQKNRFLFLKKLYEVTDGNPSYRINGEELAEEIGIDRSEAENIYYYLIGEDLIEPAGMGLFVSITHAGVLEVEEALTNPEKPTEHFLPFNVITIGSMNNSVIQQGSHSSTQSVSGFNIEKAPEIKDFLEELKTVISMLNLSVNLQNEMMAEIQTTELQINSPKPKGIIIRESLISIRSILEGLVVDSITSGLIAKIILLIPVAAN